MDTKHTNGFSEMIDDLFYRLKKANADDDLQLVNVLISLMWSLSRDIAQNGTDEQKRELKNQTAGFHNNSPNSALDYWKSITAGTYVGKTCLEWLAR